MNRVLPLLLSAVLLGASSSATATVVSRPLLANLQETFSTLIRQAAALQAARHPAQAATLYLKAGDLAAGAHQLDAAAAAYERAAAAFHLANDPGNEATAFERAADVYAQQAGVNLPEAGKPTTPAQAPTRQAPQTPPVKPAALAAVEPVPTLQVNQAAGGMLKLGAYRCTSWHVGMSIQAPYPDIVLGSPEFRFAYAGSNKMRFTSGPLSGTEGTILTINGQKGISFETNTDNINCSPR